MKRLVFVASMLLLVTGVHAQSAHSVQLTYGASSDAGSNPSLTYNVYRATSACTSTPTFAKINASPVTGLSFSDPNVSVGNTYCYQVTAVLNGLESAPSNSASAVILPSSPQTLVATPSK